MTPLKAATFLLAVVATMTTVHGREWTVAPRGSNGTNLTEALAALESNSVIYLEPGTHRIERFRLLQDLTNVSIAGRGSQAEVIVRCAENIGLAFVNVSDLTIENLSLDGCGLSQENLNQTVVRLREIVDVFFRIPNDTHIGLFLGHCPNLIMQGVTISNTEGLGMVGINIIGNSRMSDVEFSRNIRPYTQCAVQLSLLSGVTRNSAQIGGGAFILYSDYQPAFETIFREAVTLKIEQGNFTENSECTYEGFLLLNAMQSITLRDLGYSIGGGGGLTMFLAQQNYGVEVNVSSTLIQSNTARIGSGALVGIFSEAVKNNVYLHNCVVNQNGFTPADLFLPDVMLYAAVGGGMAILNDLIPPSREEPAGISPERNVSVNIINTTFEENGAGQGGAMYIYSTHTTPVIDSLDATFVFLNNCSFLYNVATAGSAFAIAELKFSGLDPGIQTIATDLTVRFSITVEQQGEQLLLSPSRNGAAVQVTNSNFTIQGNSAFEYNRVTAIAGSGAVIGFNGKVLFSANIGIYGGALYLAMNSIIVFSPNSSTQFLDNAGRIQGGAIYVSEPSICSVFFGYSDFVVCDGCLDFEKMNIFVEFQRNFALNGSLFYGDPFASCPWINNLTNNAAADVLEILSSDYSEYFNFGNNNLIGTGQVLTNSRYVILYDPSGFPTTQLSYQAIPGQTLTFGVAAFDGFGQDIAAVLSTYVIDAAETSGISSNNRLVLGTSGYFPIPGEMPATVDVTVAAAEKQTITGAVYSLDAGFEGQVTLKIEVQTCPEGFQFSNETRTCQCIDYLVENGITCDASRLEFVVPQSKWFGPISDGGEVTVHLCELEYCENDEKVVRITNGTADYNSQCANGQNRGGVGCGSCLEGYSLTLGGTACRKCSNVFILLLVVFALFGIGLVTVVAFFRITITYGLLNGVLFYSNIVSFYAPDLAPSGPYGGRFIFTSFLTLNFGIESCFHSRLTALERLGWQLIFPLYLFILMLLITAFARILKFKSVTGTNIIQAFSTLMLFCYVSVLQASVELLGVDVYDTSGGNKLYRWNTNPSIAYYRGVHGFLATVAIILILFYIIPFPLFLLFPTVLYRNRRLGKFKPFYDAFWNPFKLKFRRWLGLRLIFRWIPFAMAIFSSVPTSLFVTEIFILAQLFLLMTTQPFNDFWVNFSDGLLLLNLAFLFTGSLFYHSLTQAASDDKAVDSILRQASAFTTVFVVLAYIQFAVIIFYHCVIRFPALKKFLKEMCEKCKRNKLGRKILGEPDPEVNPSTDPQTQDTPTELSVSQSGKADNFTSSVVSRATFTELREPLLEEGIADVVSVSPSNNGHHTY